MFTPSRQISIAVECPSCYSVDCHANGDTADDGTMYVTCWGCGQSHASDDMTHIWAALKAA